MNKENAKKVLNSITRHLMWSVVHTEEQLSVNPLILMQER